MAQPGGLAARRGHTEGSVELARKHGYPLITLEDLAAFTREEQASA